ncbi:hypothetical protein ABGB09_29720 [Streptomyces sp. B8F3]|uniref:hypothetical protein n=1 Tax=Streptomyces sp. B8F3 TaxID=3153573 RepID=UPI00325C4531
MGGFGESGGSRALCELIDAHGAALVADFRRFYGLDLADALYGERPVAPPVLLALVEELPDTSALAVSLRGGAEHRGWDLHAHLVASVIDAVGEAAWVTAQASSKKRIRRPKPFPRPATARRPVTVAGLADRFHASPGQGVIRR